MGGGGKQSQTSTAEPWSAAQPYLKDVYSQAQGLYQGGGPQFWGGGANAALTPEMQQAMSGIWNRGMAGDPYLPAAQAGAGGVAGGAAVGANPAYNFLMGNVYGGNQNPAMDYATKLASGVQTNPALQYLNAEASGANMGQNPWLEAQYNRAASPMVQQFREATVPALTSDYALTGRYGSRALSSAIGQAQQGVGRQLNDLATGIYGGAYEADRARQAQAAQGLTGAYAQDIQNRLGVGGFLSGIYDQDLARRLQGSQQLGQLGQQDITNMLNAAGMVPQLQAAGYNDLNQAMNVAGMGQQRSQAELDLERQRYEYGQQQPYNWLQNYAQLIYGNPGSQTGFGTTTQTARGGGGGLFGQIMGGLSSAASIASAFSDRRVKTDVKRVGKLDNDLPVYLFRYVWGGPPQIGVMAQDVEKVHPEAVNDNTNVWGIKTVDYRKAVRG
jgi:hypothetical protein